MATDNGTRLKNLGSIIKTIREQQGLSQTALANASVISVQFLCDIEHGRSAPSLFTLEHIASELKVNIGELVNYYAQDLSGEDWMILKAWHDKDFKTMLRLIANAISDKEE